MRSLSVSCFPDRFRQGPIYRPARSLNAVPEKFVAHFFGAPWVLVPLTERFVFTVELVCCLVDVRSSLATRIRGKIVACGGGSGHFRSLAEVVAFLIDTSVRPVDHLNRLRAVKPLAPRRVQSINRVAEAEVNHNLPGWILPRSGLNGIFSQPSGIIVLSLCVHFCQHLVHHIVELASIFVIHRPCPSWASNVSFSITLERRQKPVIRVQSVLKPLSLNSICL